MFVVESRIEYCLLCSERHVQVCIQKVYNLTLKCYLEICAVACTNL